MTRRCEPDRRLRILEVTLDVIDEHGVAGTTHRKIAAAADVPLGAMTHCSTGLADLFTSAFTLLAQRWGDAVADAVLAGLTDDVRGSRRQAVLSTEPPDRARFRADIARLAPPPLALPAHP